MLIQLNTENNMIRKRKFATYTINTEILSKFNEIADNLCINKSKLVESLISNWISGENICPKEKDINRVKNIKKK